MLVLWFVIILPFKISAQFMDEANIDASGRSRRDSNVSFKGYFSLLDSVAYLGFVCLDMLLHTVDKEEGMLWFKICSHRRLQVFVFVSFLRSILSNVELVEKKTSKIELNAVASHLLHLSIVAHSWYSKQVSVSPAALPRLKPWRWANKCLFVLICMILCWLDLIMM